MQTSIAANSKRGFSLLEILIALALVSLVLVAANVSTGNQARELLDKSIDTFERSFRFMANEAVLRRKIIRLVLPLNESPVKLKLQAGPSDSFVLPEFKTTFSDESSLGIQDIQKRDKILSDLAKNFEDIEELAEKTLEFNEDLKLIAYANGRRDILIMDLHAAFYQYPSGERDDAIIIISNREELAFIRVQPFTDEVEVKYYPLNPDSTQSITDQEFELAERLYKEWRDR